MYTSHPVCRLWASVVACALCPLLVLYSMILLCLFRCRKYSNKQTDTIPCSVGADIQTGQTDNKIYTLISELYGTLEGGVCCRKILKAEQDEWVWGVRMGLLAGLNGIIKLTK